MARSNATRALLLVLSFAGTHAFSLIAPSRACASRTAAATMALPSDEDLFASLRKRMSVSEDNAGAPPPLGPDEVGADQMGPSDVVEYCMKSLLAQKEGCSTDGCRYEYFPGNVIRTSHPFFSLAAARAGRC